MCYPGESTLTPYNSYWYPHQWEKAVAMAVFIGKNTNRKQRVMRVSYGWVLDPKRRK